MAPRLLGRRLGRRLCRTKRSSRSLSAASRDTEDAKRNSRPPPAAPSDRKDALLGTLTNPAHVLNRDTPRGWAVIQRAVDEFDKDQIEGVKNDIDTLLVFIGLFSAVLSAFLVVAVALLQEDIPGATLTTLRQMSAQNANYTIQGDFIISTSPVSTSSPPFEPTVNAIRINDLWAASLVISLATASFGILVKQWLREYMKFVTSFPQGRLRIRSFRRAGLETWKVLTIAACLPLLLQFALGLFFVGLCFYTAELHSSVRNTTLPLVAGWGFIFFFVTVSPLLSAHCPYKTPALDSLVVTVRCGVRARWKAFLGDASSRAVRILWDSSFRGRMAKAIYSWTKMHFDRLDAPTEPYEEVTAAKHEAGDLDIMVAADALQGNDEIVGTAMVDALQQITPKPEDIIQFVLKILQHRVLWEGDSEKEPQIIDCSMATTHTLDSIQSLLEQHLPINKITIPSNADAEFAKVTSWTAALYLSVGSRGFRRVPSLPWEPLDKRQEVFVQVALSVPSAPGLRALLHLTCDLCRKSQLDLVQSISSVKSVVEPFFTKLDLADSFESDNYNAPWRKVLNEGSLRDTIGFLTNLLRDDTAAQDGEWSDTQHDALSLIIKLIASNPWGFQDSIAAVRRMTLSSKSDAVVVKILTLFIKSYPDSFNRYVRHEDFYTDTAALSRVAAAIETSATNSPDQLTRLSVLKACHSLAWSLYHARDDVKGTALTESWRGVFAAFTSLVQAATMLEGGMDVEPEWIHSCFIALSGLGAENEYRDRDDEEKYSAWRTAFKPEESFVPDGFYLALMDIYIPETRYGRMRRLQEMTAEEKQAAKKDIEPYLRKRAADNLDNSAAGPSTERGEGSGGGAGAVDGSGRVDVPGEVKECGGSSDDTDRVDAPREAEGHGDFGNNPEVDAEELELDTNVAPAPESDGHRLAADGKHGAEPDEAISEDTVEPNLEAAGLSHTKSPEDALAQAAELSDTKSPNNALPEAETVADNPADKGISDDRSPESVLLDPGDNSGVIKVQDGEQGLGSSGDGGEQAGTDVGHDEGIVDEGLQRSEDDHVMTFR